MPPKGSKKSKRKAEEAPADEPEEKAPKTEGGGDHVKTMNWLLSDDKALDLITDDEVGTKGQRSYRSAPGDLSPFEELVCAMLLAKPISHKLGLRSIRTVLNDPWTLNTPGKVLDAGTEKIYEALSDAKTQHKDKTADQLTKMASTLVEDHSEDKDDDSLAKIREEAEKDPKKIKELLSKSIKGIGGMAVDLLFRRLQAYWEELYPFADKRTLQALQSFKLPAKSAKELADLMEKHWDDLENKKSSKAATFALILDRAIALELDEQGGRALNALADE